MQFNKILCMNAFYFFLFYGEVSTFTAWEQSKYMILIKTAIPFAS